MTKHYGGNEVTMAERLARWLVIANWLLALVYLVGVVDPHLMEAFGDSMSGSTGSVVLGVVLLLAWVAMLTSAVLLVPLCGLLFIVLAAKGKWAGFATAGFWLSMMPSLFVIGLLLFQYVSGDALVFQMAKDGLIPI